MQLRRIEKHRLNLISAHTCVGKAPVLSPFLPSRFGGFALIFADYFQAKIRIQTGAVLR